MACDTIVGNVAVTYTSDKGFKTGSRTRFYGACTSCSGSLYPVVKDEFAFSLRILIIAVDAAAAEIYCKITSMDVLSPPKSMVATEALVADEL